MSKKKKTSPEIQDASPYVHQRAKIKFELNIRERNDLTDKQKEILSTILHKETNCVFIDGVYGSSKSWSAVFGALQLIELGKCDGLIYIRNPVESSSTGKLGYMPGSLQEKMDHYAAPLYDKLEELLPKTSIQNLKNDNRINIMPLGFIRGHSWNCKAIVVDEASSLTYEDLILIMTRIGRFSKLIVVGDSLNQSDIGNKSGFRRIFNLFNDEDSKKNGIHCFELRDKSDIVRSEFVRFVIEKLGLLK